MNNTFTLKPEGYVMTVQDGMIEYTFKDEEVTATRYCTEGTKVYTRKVSNAFLRNRVLTKFESLKGA